MSRTPDPNRSTDILQAARKVFLQQGYVNARMADIAEAAGVAAGTLYRYFESKEMLAQALSEQLFDRLTHELVPLLSKATGPDVLPQILAAVLSAADDYRDVLTIAPMRLGNGRDPVARRPRRQFVRKLATVLEERMTQGVIRRYEPQSLADMMTVLLQRFVMECLVWQEGQQQHFEATVIQMLQLTLFPETQQPAHLDQPAFTALGSKHDAKS